MDVHLWAPIAKVEVTDDGGRQVWGFATAEVVDSQGEIIDFPGTVEAFGKWSSQVEKDSRGLSRGNVRRMHDSDAVGKVLDWHAGEKPLEDGGSAKGVYVGVRVPSFETRTIGQLDEGILTGFSIGGSYAKRWYDAEAQAHRYVPELTELSLVDRPAVPVATFDVVKMHQGGGLVVNGVLLKAEGLDDEERKKLHDEAEARAKKYGIAFKGKGNLTPPAGKPTDEGDYGDPVNYAYPIDEAHIRAAVGYFNHPDAREKGEYSAEEWANIGERIAERANKLIGDGHEFKDGKIETSDERKEAEKAALAGALAKAVQGAQLSHGDIRGLISQALNDKTGPFDEGLWPQEIYDDHAIVTDWGTDKTWSIPYQIKDGKAVLGDPTEVRQTWEPVEPAKGEKAVKATLRKAGDPDDRAVDEKIRAVEEALAQIKAAQDASEKQDGKPQEKGNEEINARIEAAEKALAELKAAQAKDEGKEDPGGKPKDDDDKGDAEKAAQAAALLKAVTDGLAKRSVPVAAHRRKHLRHAIDHIHAAMDEHDDVEDKDHIAMTDGRKPEGAEDEAEKAAAAALRKVVGGDGDLAKTLGAALDRAALAKAADVSKIAEEQVKAASRIEALEGLVKSIAEQPQQGGPMVGPVPGVGGAMPWQGLEKQALANLMDRTDDPIVKEAIGRELAVGMLAGAYAASRSGMRDPSPAMNPPRQ